MVRRMAVAGELRDPPLSILSFKTIVTFSFPFVSAGKSREKKRNICRARKLYGLGTAWRIRRPVVTRLPRRHSGAVVPCHTARPRVVTRAGLIQQRRPSPNSSALSHAGSPVRLTALRQPPRLRWKQARSYAFSVHCVLLFASEAVIGAGVSKAICGIGIGVRRK